MLEPEIQRKKACEVKKKYKLESCPKLGIQ